MTLSKLSLRNAKRQAGDYLIYFVTIVMAASLLYAFNGLVFSGEVQELSHRMAMVMPLIVASSIVVVCIFGWLVSYAANFMLTRRSREMGLYILIGLENKQVARLFFLENLVVGTAAFALGILFGALLFQILRAVVFSLFGQTYRFAFMISFKAAGLTAVYFVLIYLRALKKSRKKIRTMKIYDLIYFDRQNEGAVIRTGRKRRRIFNASIVLGILGTFLLMTGQMFLGLIGAGCVIAFLYGFFLSFASGVPDFFEKHGAKKWRGQNLLVFRTLTAKLGTMGIIMATLSLLFTATLISEGMGLVFRGIFEGRAAQSGCFDLYLAQEGENPPGKEYMDYIERNIPVENAVSYQVYLNENTQLMDFILESDVTYHTYDYDGDPVMRYSDYARLREMAGYKEAPAAPGQYLLHCMRYLEDTLENDMRPVTVGNRLLTRGGIYTEHFMQSFGIGNGHGYLLVVPDEAAENLPVHHTAYAAATVFPVSGEQLDGLTRIEEGRMETGDYDVIVTRAGEMEEAAVSTAGFVFPLYFVSLALVMTAATILTIQQLSESGRYRRQFILLRKLGMDRRDMVKALRMQFMIYYAMPAAPPVLIGVPFILHAARAPEPGVMVGANSPAAIAVTALVIFFAVYVVYILTAYTSLKRNVLSDILDGE